ncbi:tetratricopeptide repeat protein [Pseudomonadota bacterium]
MSLFEELKRRNVFRVAAAYIIVGWLIMQAGEVMGPALHLPEWVNSLLAFFLILGFPLAMFFAWAFELTPDGLKKEKDVDKTQSMVQVTGQKLNYTIIVLMAAALAYFAWEKFASNPENEVGLAQASPETEQTKPVALSNDQLIDKKSIAVIPFRNRSVNEENAEFFSDGVHDELLTNLSRIEELKVISRTSVMNYRDTIKNMKQIGEELGVANILEGGVQRAGNTVRINVQLIDAATDEHLWAKVYDRQLTAENIFAIQTEIARAIANALEATLSPREQKLLATAPTTNLEAYDNLLIAGQLLNRGNWQNIRDAQVYLKKAIELDPDFIQAHVALAMSYSGLFTTGATTLQEVSAPWQQSIQAALSLDPDNAGAIAVQALYLWRHGLDGVEKAFEKALQLEPHNVETLTMYADYLRKNFHLDRALPLFEMARELDPVSIDVLRGLARIRLARGEMDQALEIFARIRQVDPSSVSGYGPVAGAYIDIGDMVQGSEWLFKAMEIDPQDSDLSNWVVMVYISSGDFDSARKWLQWIEHNQNQNPMFLANMAILNISEDNLEAAVMNARQALDSQMQDRWGSDAVMVRTLLIWTLDQGRTGTALEVIRQAHPELFDHPPVVHANNVLQAIDTAQLLQLENRDDEAKKLLQASIAAYDKPYTVTDSWLAPGKAQALALLGEKQAALKELRHQVDKGWRLLWRWNSELNPNFESLREDPEFHAIIEFLDTDMARQLESIRAMEAAGEFRFGSGYGTDHERQIR